VNEESEYVFTNNISDNNPKLILNNPLCQCCPTSGLHSACRLISSGTPELAKLLQSV